MWLFCLGTVLIGLSTRRSGEEKKKKPKFQLTSSIFHYKTDKCLIAMRTNCILMGQRNRNDMMEANGCDER